MNADILNMGQAFNIKGRHSNHYYEGLLFAKSEKNENTFTGKQYIVDIKAASGNQVDDWYDIIAFEDGIIPLNLLKGDRYMIIDGRPRFGKQYSTLEDLKGT